MRVNLDDPDNDPRVRRLARLLGLPVLHTVGVLFGVWRSCYVRRTPLIEEHEIDLAGETEGLAQGMLVAGLATIEADPSNDEAPASKKRVVRVNGISVRIGFLEQASQKGQRGGIASGIARRNKAESKRKEQQRSK